MSCVLESTERCPGAPIAMLALREAGVTFERVIRADGYFLATHGIAGPVLRRGDEVTVGLRAILQRLRSDVPALWPAQHGADIERWIGAAFEVGPALGKLREGAQGSEREAALASLARAFAALDTQLAHAPFLCGDAITGADLPWVAIPASGPLAAMLPPRVQAYAERLRARL